MGENKKVVVITFGTFDLLHIGHINLLVRAKMLGDKLIVGVSTDNLNKTKKQRVPVYCEQDRLSIVKNIQGVDKVFLEESLEQKAEYIKKYDADVLVMGDDWKGRFNFLQTELQNLKIVYLPRTENISTTMLIDYIKNNL